MRGDYSRERFDPKKDFCAVLMQQGRVLLDADWNEQALLLDRRLRAETTDIIGRCAVARRTPGEVPADFQIGFDGQTMTVGIGRIYVGGHLVENHGIAPLGFDAVLSEERGTGSIPYTEQPCPAFKDGFFTAWPHAGRVATPAEGRHLVYLDVWQREVTHDQEPGLKEQAVGVDTTTRLQTVWLVRWDPSGTLTCEEAEQRLLDRQTPGGRLSTSLADPGDDAGPCLIPPGAGFRGLEHALYYVEIHQAGALGTATFKWTSDASLVTAVTRIDGVQLTVARTQWDSVRSFQTGDWVEVSDDWHEFSGLPGAMTQIDGVDHHNRTITLDAALSNDFATDDQEVQARRTLIRRWEGDGEIEIPADGSPVPLGGDGVQVTFSTIDDEAKFRTGQCWSFAARASDTGDGSIEILENAPPRGGYHHYCPLAIVDFPSTLLHDCRNIWPPESVAAGCGCTVCVTAESHESGQLTIQEAINRVRLTGGNVCLEAGDYVLNRPVDLTAAQSVRLVGKGARTVLWFPRSDDDPATAGPAVTIHGNAFDVRIQDVTLATQDQVGIDLQDSLAVTIERCVLGQTDLAAQTANPVIALGGSLFNVVIRDNTILDCVTGLASAAPLLTLGLYVQDNAMTCQRSGIRLDGINVHLGEARILGNTILGCSDDAVFARGLNYLGLDVKANKIAARGNGITVGGNALRIIGNDISPASDGGGGDGITLVGGLPLRVSTPPEALTVDPADTGQNDVKRYPLERCQVVDNRVTHLGNGIAVRTGVRSAMVKNNCLEAIGRNGIFMDENSWAESIAIENNHLLNVCTLPTAGDNAAIAVRHANHVAIGSNTIHRFARTAAPSAQPTRLMGIYVSACTSIQVKGNEVIDVGPTFMSVAAPVFIMGIAVEPTYGSLDLVDNVLRRSQRVMPAGDQATWIAMGILGGVHIDPNVPPPPPILGNRFFVAAGNFVFETAADNVIQIARGAEVATIRGNLCEGYGGQLASSSVVQAEGVVVFSDNRCVLRSDAPPDGSLGAACRISPGALIANNNYFDVPPNWLAMRIDASQDIRFSIVGNIGDGDIVMGLEPLQAPWRPLNNIPTA